MEGHDNRRVSRFFYGVSLMKRFILIFFSGSFLFPQVVEAQNPGQQGITELSVGAGSKTGSDSASGQGQLKYEVPIGTFQGRSSCGKGVGFYDFRPDVLIQYSDDSLFDSVQMGLDGVYGVTPCKVVDGRDEWNFLGLSHVFLFGAGIETDSKIENVNGILEIGYVPYYPGLFGESRIKYGPNVLLGFFLQAGYKFDTGGDDGEDLENKGGSEVSDTEIGRAKTRLQLSFPLSDALELVGDFSLWYDFVNDDVYDKSEFGFRVKVAEDQFVDLLYNNGSGAPNFLTGEKFSASYTIRF